MKLSLIQTKIIGQKKTSTLNEKIMGRNHLVFLIEDEDGEQFGFYHNDEIVDDLQIKYSDRFSFYFNLKSNGRLPTPMKFKQKTSAMIEYKLSSKRIHKLIQLGDILLFKEDFKEKSLCRRNVDKCYGDYNGIDVALCGKSGPKRSGMNFIPKRILVIQMV